MKIEELKNLDEQGAKQIIVELFNSFESDFDFYTEKGDSILASIYKTRMERVHKKLKDMEKRFKHDCEKCVFLGQFNEYDLYFCDAGITTVIARSSDGPDYTSGLCFATKEGHNALYEAKQRAIKENLYGE